VERLRKVLDGEKDPKQAQRIRDWLKTANPDEPLRQRLADSVELDEMLGCPETLPAEEVPAHWAHGYYLPAAAELVGRPDDRPGRGPRRLLSLWALINLQLDTWRGAEAKTDPMALTPLARWLKQLHEDRDLAVFDQASKPAALGQGLKDRVDRLQLFVAFRAACADEAVLQELVVKLKSARNAGRPADLAALKGGCG
jgi:hypothetical protein